MTCNQPIPKTDIKPQTWMRRWGSALTWTLISLPFIAVVVALPHMVAMESELQGLAYISTAVIISLPFITKAAQEIYEAARSGSAGKSTPQYPTVG